ncbi:hypothetical protein K474DRAFT_1714213 [Panus rudis PR-1116 ss-1]|nr:hypothetical protein K474DRAFT_1714213 [Panus rudis PR-1116 ss-1]
MPSIKPKNIKHVYLSEMNKRPFRNDEFVANVTTTTPATHQESNTFSRILRGIPMQKPSELLVRFAELGLAKPTLEMTPDESIAIESGMSKVLAYAAHAAKLSSSSHKVAIMQRMQTKIAQIRTFREWEALSKVSKGELIDSLQLLNPDKTRSAITKDWERRMERYERVYDVCFAFGPIVMFDPGWDAEGKFGSSTKPQRAKHRERMVAAELLKGKTRIDHVLTPRQPGIVNAILCILQLVGGAPAIHHFITFLVETEPLFAMKVPIPGSKN